MKRFAAYSSLLLLGTTVSYFIHNLMTKHPELQFTFSEEDIYLDL